MPYEAYEEINQYLKNNSLEQYFSKRESQGDEYFGYFVSSHQKFIKKLVRISDITNFRRAVARLEY